MPSRVDSLAARFGYTEAAWNAARTEMTALLQSEARSRGVIPYSKVCAKVRTIVFAPDSPALASMLGEISRAEDADGRGMLTVLVVHKTGDQKPGPGFYELARDLAGC